MPLRCCRARRIAGAAVHTGRPTLASRRSKRTCSRYKIISYIYFCILKKFYYILFVHYCYCVVGFFVSGFLCSFSPILKWIQLKNDRDYLEERFQLVFRHLFVNRYRDISEHIRTACIRELGIWIRSLTAKLLAASYIKYIAWSLNDKV